MKLFNGYGVLLIFWTDGNALGLYRSGDYTTLWNILNASELFTFKWLISCEFHFSELKCIYTYTTMDNLTVIALYDLVKCKCSSVEDWVNYSSSKQYNTIVNKDEIHLYVFIEKCVQSIKDKLESSYLLGIGITRNLTFFSNLFECLTNMYFYSQK